MEIIKLTVKTILHTPKLTFHLTTMAVLAVTLITQSTLLADKLWNLKTLLKESNGS